MSLRIAHFIPCYRSTLHIEVAYSLVRDAQWCGVNGHGLSPFYIDSCNVAVARNRAAAAAIAEGYDYLLMQDADCFVLPGQPSGLGKLYADLTNHPSAVAAALAIATRDERTNCEPADPGTVQPGEVGTGYMLIDLRLLAEWRSDKANLGIPMFHVQTNAEGTAVQCGEDLSFCRTMKAAGYDVLIDSTLKTGHVAERVLLVLPDDDQTQR